MFGKVQEIPHTEDTKFYPRSPYGISKLYAHWLAINYKESYGLFSSCGILFNHESPLRGKEFVTRKITDHVAKIFHGEKKPLELGNLDAKRDWGFAGDYVEGMYRILQASEPEVYVLASNSMNTVRDFATAAFNVAGIEVEYEGSGESEIGYNPKTGETVIKVNPVFYRPAEVELLLGKATKAKEQLSWEPTTSFLELVKMMTTADIERHAK